MRAVWERLTGSATEAVSRGAAIPQGEHSLRRLLRNLPGMAYRCRNDADWTMEFVSEGCRRLTGFTSHELVENRVVSYGGLIHPEDRDRVWREVQRALLAGTPFRTTYRIRRVDGTERWVWEQGVGVAGVIGDVDAIEGIILDITDRQELTERISEQDSQYRALVEQSLAGVYLIRDGRLEYVNPRLGEIVGYSVEELRALESIEPLIHPDDRHMVAQNLRMRSEGAVDVIRYEFRAVRKDGSIRELEAQGRRVEVEGSPAVMGVVLDVTERKGAQRRYHETQKMEALGRLATGVAHDLNNVLAVIKTTAQALGQERGGDPELTADLAQVVSAVDRGSALGRQLMTLGRSKTSSAVPMSLADAVRDVQPLLEKMLGPGIGLRLDLAPDLPAVALNPTYLEEVIMNLVINAVDAMPDGGSVTITARSRPAGAEGSPAAYRDLPHVVLQVVDTGVGIPHDVRRRLFEPYFTTKGDKGTGLGLSNVWRIARDAGGAVGVDSTPGRGTTFSVFFPVRHP